MRMHMTYMALHEVTWCMVVCCTQNAPRRQQFYDVAPAMSALLSTTIRWILKKEKKRRYKELVIHVESHASAVSLLES